MSERKINILSYGADPAGKRDSTEAIQRAVDDAAALGAGQGGVVYVPEGIYLCADVRLRTGVTLMGSGSWGYRRLGCCVLKLNQEAKHARCVLDITGAYGCTISHLTICGTDADRGKEPGIFREDGEGIHGVFLEYPDMGARGGKTEEDIPTLEHCKICGFSGDGVHFMNAWCFRIQHCQLCDSKNGLFLRGVDGFVIDNWFSANREWGIYTDPEGYNSSVIVTACRVEWNHAGGFYLTGARNWQVNGNSFDRNFGPAVFVDSSHSRVIPYSNTINICANNFNRSGTGCEGDASCHLMLQGTYGVSVTGNTFLAGANDDYQGEVSPRYAMVVRELKSTVIAANTLQNACTKQLLVDHGGHYVKKDEADPLDGMVWRDNPGCVTLPGCYDVPGYFLSVK